VSAGNSVASAFRAALSSKAEPAFVDVSDDALATTVAQMHHQGSADGIAVTVPIERFAGELARRLGPQASMTALDQLHRDIYLAIAANDGDAAAVAECDRIGQNEVDFAAARLGASVAQAQEVRSDLRRLMFTQDEGRDAAIARFSGRGDLRGYLRVIAARALARQIQRDRREVTLDDAVLDAFAPGIEPEVALLREQYRPVVDAALRAAIGGLSDRQRAVLRYHLLDGWTIDQLGQQYGVHRSTASRWLTDARDALGDRVRAELAEQLQISESQVDSIVALVTSRIELSLDRLLA
jgi:RNA polymerase sigma-70 factor (ECF subfamily)